MVSPHLVYPVTRGGNNDYDDDDNDDKHDDDNYDNYDLSHCCGWYPLIVCILEREGRINRGRAGLVLKEQETYCAYLFQRNQLACPPVSRLT
jgi:hypothetical protein